MSFPRYPKYKDSGVEWLGEVPKHWAIKRLKQACVVFPSNVDKKTYKGEIGVKLCNYTDVYYNDTIRHDMDFMSATATSEQIAKFTLRAGDTIITKDSEAADDIAIAAYVPIDVPGIVCGYHLSMIRPREGVYGAFIKRLFDSLYVKSSVAVLANGLTRVGLGQYEIDNLELPFPSLEEQIQIATFLDRETAKIDELVAEQQQLMALLKEKRQAVISHAVTKGLNPQAPMKPSGVEWLGDVPEHWGVTAFKLLVDIQNGSDYKHVEAENGYPVIGSGGSFTFASTYLYDGESVLLGRKGTIDKPLHVVGRFWTVDTMYWTKIRPSASGRYCYYTALTIPFDYYSTNTALPSMTKYALGSHLVARPSVGEQGQIAQFLDSETEKLDELVEQCQLAIVTLKERRASLISAAVTGQIDVRNFA
jgi:type I restriction enzyme, S subunit